MLTEKPRLRVPYGMRRNGARLVMKVTPIWVFEIDGQPCWPKAPAGSVQEDCKPAGSVYAAVRGNLTLAVTLAPLAARQSLRVPRLGELTATRLRLAFRQTLVGHEFSGRLLPPLAAGDASHP